MMDIDWSKAPEDATHYQPESKELCAAWIKIEGGQYKFKMMSQRSWVVYDGPVILMADIIPRPTEWTGTDGSLPPVGTVCELYIDDDEMWIKGTVVAHVILNGLEHAIAHDESSCFHGVAADFRPTRTAEQIAAKEKVSVTTQMLVDGGFKIDQSECVTRLYDAGYRKQEQK